MDTLHWVMKWYEAHCDGDWEHQYGIKVDTLDNPGWAVQIDLAETELDDEIFDALQEERTERDWMHCKVENKVFHGYGGPQNLIEILNVFRSWASAHDQDEQK